MFTKVCAGVMLFFLPALSVLAQWSPVDSGTTSDLRGVYLLDTGVGYAAGDAGTILKTTDAGMTWGTLASGTTSADSDQTELDLGQRKNSENFREDLSHNGYIDAVDLALVKGQLGTMLPP